MLSTIGSGVLYLCSEFVLLLDVPLWPLQIPGPAAMKYMSLGTMNQRDSTFSCCWSSTVEVQGPWVHVSSWASLGNGIELLSQISRARWSANVPYANMT
jgi:hypothetical protein